MQYAGPEGGFSIRLNDDADAELSESEDIECIAGNVVRRITNSSIISHPENNYEDVQSRISRSGYVMV